MINVKSGRRGLQGALLCLTLAVSLGCQAFSGGDALPKGVRLNGTNGSNGAVHITGTVVLPPCQVNNNQSVNVEFGNVRSDLIDNSSYASQPIPVSITCSGTPTGQLQLELQGVPTGFRSNVLRTSIKGLGIRVMRDGSDFALNKEIDVSKDQSFTLTAVPYTEDSHQLEAGEFTATATLVVTQE